MSWNGSSSAGASVPAPKKPAKKSPGLTHGLIAGGAIVLIGVISLYFVSGDSDLAGPVAAIRYRVKRPVAVYNPHEGACDELKRYASLYKNIPRDLPARCQLPDMIPVGTHGNFIRRPAAWL